MLETLKQLNPFQSGGDVQAQVANLDPDTEAAINQKAQEALNGSPEKIQEQINQGVSANDVGGVKSNIPSYAGMSGALQAKYNQAAERAVTGQQRENKYDSFHEYSNQINQAQQYAQAHQSVLNQAYQRRMQAYQHNLQARAQVISSIFGAAGTIAGAAAGKPPTGKPSGGDDVGGYGDIGVGV